jgi:hypothetical protein
MPMSPRLLRPRQTSKYAALRTGLVAYWPLNETAASGDVTAEDWTKRGNNLTSNNSVLSVAGKVNNARQFVTANTEFLSIASNADVQFGEDAYTLALWLYVPSSASGTGQIVAKDNSPAGAREFELHYNGAANDIRLFVYASDDVAAGAAQVSAARDAWHFLAVTHAVNSNTVTLRVNTSTSTTVRPDAKTYAKTSTAFHVGSRLFPPFQQYLTGNVDEVAKWSRVLSTTELDTLYNSGNGIDLRT